MLEGSLRFHFEDRSVEVPAGGTVYVPAGVAHTYESLDARYLIVLPPRLAALIAELQRAPAGTDYPAIYRRYESTLLE